MYRKSMKSVNKNSIIYHLSEIEDPRIERTKFHNLTDIFAIAICAAICGCEHWTEIEEFGNIKKKWFKKFLELPNGIPSHDTIGRVFAAIDTKIFSEKFSNWTHCVKETLTDEIIAIDGKTLRRSFNKAANKAAIHMVNAWSSQNHMILGQLKTEEKSNEITAVPELLEWLDVKGCIVTLDAMHCQKKTVNKIAEKGGNYVIALKGNQGEFHQDVVDFFESSVANDYPVKTVKTVEKNHGRIETRKVICCSELDWLNNKEKWKNLETIVCVNSTRKIGDKISNENRYYITSLPVENIEKIAESIRKHWEVENKLHWVLDVAFREDDSRIRKDNAPANMAILRQIALNLLKKDETCTRGIKTKRKMAGWSEEFLIHLLNN